MAWNNALINNRGRREHEKKMAIKWGEKSCSEKWNYGQKMATSCHISVCVLVSLFTVLLCQGPVSFTLPFFLTPPSGPLYFLSLLILPVFLPLHYILPIPPFPSHNIHAHIPQQWWHAFSGCSWLSLEHLLRWTNTTSSHKNCVCCA